ncbi:TIR domain-containing protein [Arsenophonus sp.]|uniref:TIR domain-containing protein n=1 Tax=Arsenophonus sp. TaxID=1872640 RepID=UPI002861F3A9|nr:TIR domain-containing protein [Arsenophonus sp.]MDR5617838.1 TIR domain-containing protein [Arsenophonus sp.]
MIVRNSNIIIGANNSGFIDKADFEKVERQGYIAIKSWIDKQLEGTTVTVVLVGKNTNKSKWVNYEIEKSIARRNGILTIDISKIKDLHGKTTDCCDLRVGGYRHYLWNKENGQKNLGSWVELAAKNAGK